MLTAFWGMKGPMSIDFLEKGGPLNSVYYCLLLKQNSPYLLNDPHTFKYKADSFPV